MHVRNTLTDIAEFIVVVARFNGPFAVAAVRLKKDLISVRQERTEVEFHRSNYNETRLCFDNIFYIFYFIL